MGRLLRGHREHRVMTSMIQKDSASHIPLRAPHCVLRDPLRASLWSLTQSPDTERQKQVPTVLQTTQDSPKPFTPRVHDSIRLCGSYTLSCRGPGSPSAGRKTPASLPEIVSEAAGRHPPRRCPPGTEADPGFCSEMQLRHWTPNSPSLPTFPPRGQRARYRADFGVPPLSPGCPQITSNPSDSPSPRHQGSGVRIESGRSAKGECLLRDFNQPRIVFFSLET